MFKPVKNFAEGRTSSVKVVCIHIADGNAWQVYNTFNSEPKSSHYLVLRNGDIWQFVKEEDTAWANGLKVRPTAKVVLEHINENPNNYTISIEHEGLGSEDLTEIQYVSSGKLLGEICKRHSLGLNRSEVIGHNEIRADKACPGLISISKLIQLAYNPPQISEIETLKIKISLLQKILELLKSIASYKKLGNISHCELSKD